MKACAAKTWSAFCARRAARAISSVSIWKISSLTEATLATYAWARDQGYDHLGVVIQSYLRRSQADVQALMQRQARVRLVKGAYQEPPQVAFPEKRVVDENFDRLTTLLLQGALAAGAPEISTDGRVPPIPALATHDEQRIHFAEMELRRLNVPKGAVEFQMLYGIRRELQEALVAQGYPVRVYVPYGARWYPYFMRRLAERPANVGFFLSNYFRK